MNSHDRIGDREVPDIHLSYLHALREIDQRDCTMFGSILMFSLGPIWLGYGLGIEASQHDMDWKGRRTRP